MTWHWGCSFSNQSEACTFALQPLPEEAFQQPFAVLADGGTGVGVNGKGVRNFNSTEDHLLHPDWTPTHQWVTLPCTHEGALLEKKNQVSFKQIFVRMARGQMSIIDAHRFLFVFRNTNKPMTDYISVTSLHQRSLNSVCSRVNLPLLPYYFS